MENHPIPQDVTGFKFRLIGSITVKQFLYLLGAGAIALVFYLLPMPVFIKIPLMLTCAGIGLSLAFVPIDGRPMDKMLLNFIRTIPSENQYLYHKQGAEMPYFAFTPVIKAVVPSVQRGERELNKKTLLFNQLNRAYFKPDPEEQAQVANISNLFQEGAAPNQGFITKVTNVGIPTQTVKPASEDLAKPHSAPVQQAKTEPEVQKTPARNASHSDAGGPPSISPAGSPLPGETPPLSLHPESQAQANGTYMPNIIQGVILDPRGKTVPQVIVEIIDSNNIPLRTFKTSQEGTFRAATPLPNGTYTIHLEDTLKKQEFSDVSVTLDGNISQPVTIKSVDQREKLRQELFGGII